MKKMKSTQFITEKTNKNDAKRFNGMGMFIKLGVCASVCALVMLVKIADMKDTTASYSAVYAEYDAVSAQKDDELGKLRFVELPGILQVFSTSDRYELPLKNCEIQAVEENNELVIKSNGEQYVSAAARCSVKTAENNTVTVSFDGDCEVSYAGNMEINVEEGQMLKEGDTIAKIASGETLTVRTNIAGRPVDPQEVFFVE
ncbi:MAG: hypothetical protein IJO48_04075 [Clostridia bacterium]|nr:hypothetical protein [Clostridia bacterium]